MALLARHYGKQKYCYKHLNLKIQKTKKTLKNIFALILVEFYFA